MNIEAKSETKAAQTDANLVVPLIVRGKVVESYLSRHKMRGGVGEFLAPDLTRLLDKLPTSAVSLRELHSISIDDIIDFLADVGASLSLAHNPHLRLAFEISSHRPLFPAQKLRLGTVPFSQPQWPPLIRQAIPSAWPSSLIQR
jgi:hypothetical protein